MRIFGIRIKYLIGFIVIATVFTLFGVAPWKASVIAMAATAYAAIMERGSLTGTH